MPRAAKSPCCKPGCGHLAAGRRVHPDAAAVWSAVSAAGGVVLHQARIGIRPTWYPAGANTRMVAVLNRWHRPTVERNRGHRPWLCPVIGIPSVETVAMARREYRTCPEGLTALADSFASNPGRLTVHSVSGFKTPGFPWLRGSNEAAI